jgi:hypothetical protein
MSLVKIGSESMALSPWFFGRMLASLTPRKIISRKLTFFGENDE